MKYNNFNAYNIEKLAYLEIENIFNLQNFKDEKKIN